MVNIIQWKKGSKLSGKAEPVYNELEDLRAKTGSLTADAVVARAKSNRSAMHKHFEWDDSVAAEKHRKEQARSLIRSIEIVHVEAPTVAAKAYTIVTAPQEGAATPKKVYQSTAEALQDPVSRDEILGSAIRDALSYRRKYNGLQELAQVFTALDDFVENFN